MWDKFVNQLTNMPNTELGKSSRRGKFGHHFERTIPAGAILALCVSALAQQPAKPTEDLPAGSMQAKATTACTECHEARIIVQQRLSKGAWVKEVDKMIKWGAVVDASDHDALVDYLSANFSPDKPPYVPPLTASGRR